MFGEKRSNDIVMSNVAQFSIAQNVNLPKKRCAYREKWVRWLFFCPASNRRYTSQSSHIVGNSTRATIRGQWRAATTKKKRQKLGENEKVDDGKNKSWAEENRRQKKFDASESYVRPVMEHLLLHV